MRDDPPFLARLRERLSSATPADASAVSLPPSTEAIPQDPTVTPLRPAAFDATRQALRDADDLDESIAKAADFIARHEGFRGQAYKDLRGAGHPWTVGYGRTGAGVDSTTTMSELEARDWLQRRVREDALRLQQAGVPAHPALLSFVYNAGHNRLRSSGALDAALRNDWKAVGDAMMRVIKGRDAQHNLVTLPGLVRRRQQEVAMLQDLLTGEMDQ